MQKKCKLVELFVWKFSHRNNAISNGLFVCFLFAF